MDVPFIITAYEMQVVMVFSASRPHLMFHSVKYVHIHSFKIFSLKN